MGALAGIYYRESCPVPRSALDALSVGNVELAPDRQSLHVGDGIALLAFALHFDRFSERERQPIVSSDGSILLWDGRLDNRDDLLMRLRRALRDDLSDARLVACALEHWPNEALSELLGDWSLAHWRPRSRELLLARDYAGNRPLYYYEHRDYFVWSTAMEAIVELVGLAGEASDTFFAGQLTLGAPDHYTCYRDLFKVPAGHVLRVRAGRQTQCAPICELAPTTVRYVNRTSYEEHFRASFTEAIRVRLRSNRAVWTELSGGYDSSAVTCIASSLVSAGVVDAPMLRPVSIVAPQDSDADDTRYIESVERYCELQGARFQFHDQRDLFELPPLGTEWPQSRHRSHLDLAVESGCRVLLTGQLGDLVTVPISATDLLATHLRSGHLRAFIADSLAACRASRQPLPALWRALFTSLTSTPEVASRNNDNQCLRNRIASRGLPPHTDLATAFDVRADFLKKSLILRDHQPLSFGRVPRSFRGFLWSLHRAVTIDFLTGVCAPLPLGVTHPFSHRPLLCFLMGSPPEILWSSMHPRAFMCNALYDVLPDDILYRGSKQHATPIMHRAIHTLLSAELPRVNHWHVVQRGYVESAVLANSLHRYLAGERPDANTAVSMLFAERLLRRMRLVPKGYSASAPRQSVVARGSLATTCQAS